MNRTCLAKLNVVFLLIVTIGCSSTRLLTEQEREHLQARISRQLDDKGVPERSLRVGPTGMISIDLKDSTLTDLSFIRDIQVPILMLDISHTTVSDLSPLKGKNILGLDISRTSPSDFSILHKLPLRFLYMSQTLVTDLSFLKGLPLLMLDISGTGVHSLEPLSAMRLVSLDIQGTLIEDLSPLRGMPLEDLDVSTFSVTDLSPIAEAPLVSLGFWTSGVTNGLSDLRNNKTIKKLGYWYNRLPAKRFWEKYDAGDYINDYWGFEKEPEGTNSTDKLGHTEREARRLAIIQSLRDGGIQTDDVSIDASGSISIGFHYQNNVSEKEISVLRGIPVTSLNLSMAPVTNLPPLRGLTIRHLDLSRAEISSLAALDGLLLQSLKLNSCDNVTDLAPLKGMPLQELELIGTSVTNLSPLSGMKLKVLRIDNTPVTNIDHLAGAPLETFTCRHTKVNDFSPLRGTPLKLLAMDGVTPANLTALEDLPIKYLYVTSTGLSERCIESLGELRSLERINDLSLPRFLEQRKVLLAAYATVDKIENEPYLLRLSVGKDYYFTTNSIRVIRYGRNGPQEIFHRPWKKTELDSFNAFFQQLPVNDFESRYDNPFVFDGFFASFVFQRPAENKKSVFLHHVYHPVPFSIFSHVDKYLPVEHQLNITKNSFRESDEWDNVKKLWDKIEKHEQSTNRQETGKEDSKMPSRH